jgi:hypothetical protein
MNEMRPQAENAYDHQIDSDNNVKQARNHQDKDSGDQRYERLQYDHAYCHGLILAVAVVKFSAMAVFGLKQSAYAPDRIVAALNPGAVPIGTTGHKNGQGKEATDCGRPEASLPRHRAQLCCLSRV